MRRLRSVAGLLSLLVWASAGRAVERPAFPYDRARTPRYLTQTIATQSVGPATQLRAELSAVVAEILDGPWRPLYSDYSAGEAGGVGLAEWCFNRPGDYVRALSMAAPLLAADRQAQVHEFLRVLMQSCPPTQQVYLPDRPGKARNVRPTPPPRWPQLGDREAQCAQFAEAGAVEAYARAFDAWVEVKPLFEDLKRLRPQLEARAEFTPAYTSDHAATLTAAAAQDAEYRFRVYVALLAGFQDNYWYRGAREARRRMKPDAPVFFPVKWLSALVGYHRLARRFDEPDEAEWACGMFDHVAALTLEQKSAPYLWSDPDLSPEVGRMFRDAAGAWLDGLAATPNIGNLPALDWDQQPVPGRRDHYVMNPYTWFHAWGGQGEGIRPRTVLGAFLVQAWLFNAPAAEVRRTLDIPWCRADLYYVVKLVAAIHAAENPGWVPVAR